MCPVCNSNKVSEVWHNTKVYHVYEMENGSPVMKAEIADLCPGNGISIICCGCGETLHEGSILHYLGSRNASK